LVALLTCVADRNFGGLTIVSKIDLVVVAALIAGCAFWIERGHRITIDAPAPFELATSPAAGACPDNDRGPYSADCLAFLKGDSNPPAGWQIVVVRMPAIPAYEPRRTDLSAAACPVNDNMPYPPDCLSFLSGPLWRPE
jgi:hypothetical protein